jgi:hypothetical protein
LLRCQGKKFGQEIDLPLHHLGWRRGRERGTAHPMPRLGTENSSQDHW